MQDLSLDDRTSLIPDQIHDLLLTCVSSSCFQFQGKFYEQTAGTSMGSPLSPVLADIFMEELKVQSSKFKVYFFHSHIIEYNVTN